MTSMRLITGVRSTVLSAGDPGTWSRFDGNVKLTLFLGEGGASVNIRPVMHRPGPFPHPLPARGLGEPRSRPD